MWDSQHWTITAPTVGKSVAENHHISTGGPLGECRQWCTGVKTMVDHQCYMVASQRWQSGVNSLMDHWLNAYSGVLVLQQWWTTSAIWSASRRWQSSVKSLVDHWVNAYSGVLVLKQWWTTSAI